MSAFNRLGLLPLCIALCACSSELMLEQRDSTAERETFSINIWVDEPLSKSIDPNENLISDLNLLIFDEDGKLESRKYLSERETYYMSGGIKVDVELLRGISTTIFCCANIGYELSGIEDVASLLTSRYSLVYPDEYSRGIPMSAIITEEWDIYEKSINIVLKRMMSKVSVSLDRSMLNKDVELYVTGIEIRNCPRSVAVIGPSSAQGSRDVFAQGFCKSYFQVDALNREKADGISEEVNLYMLENMKGDLLEDTVDDAGKLLETALANVCSYIEIQAEYVSDSYHTIAGETLKYRFYLGESNYNFDIQRNCHYHFVAQFIGDGLSAGEWRIDKSSLEKK